MPPPLMSLRVLLPFEVLSTTPDVTRIVAETPSGAFGLLPRRLDCVAALTPGILTYESQRGGERFVAVDSGVLVKAGQEVLVSVRRAVQGTDLSRLRTAVESEFNALDERERDVRSVLARLETGFLRRLLGSRHE